MGWRPVAGLAVVLATVAAHGKRGATLMELNEAVSGKRVTVEAGQQLRVTLPENVTTGYSWRVAEGCGSVLRQESDEAKPGSGMPGAPGTRVWIFRVRSDGSGSCELRLESVRPWEKTVIGKTVVFPVTVRTHE